MKKTILAAIGILGLVTAGLWLMQDEPDPPIESTAGNSPSSASRDASGTSGIGGAQAGIAQSRQQSPQQPASGSGSSAGSTMPLPEPIPSDAAPAQSRVELWKEPQGNTDIEVDGIPATRLQVDPAVLRTLQVGQTVDFQVPPLNRTVSAELVSTHNQLNKVEVFKGAIRGGHEKDNVIVTRGETSTYVVIATREGVFSAVIDNASGEAVLTDEGDINRRINDQDDAVMEEGLEMPLPQANPQQ
jgi:hypothetical protein